MRPRARRETSEQDLFRSRLDQIIDMENALVKLGQAIDWRFLEERFGAVYTDKGRLIRDQNKRVARFGKAAGGCCSARNQAHILWAEGRLPFASLGIEDFFDQHPVPVEKDSRSAHRTDSHFISLASSFG
jgi:hypothetical protein